MNNDKSRRLGRGLEALIGPQLDEGESLSPTQQIGTNLMRVPIHLIQRNPGQPRKEFDKEALSELRNSLKINGLLQPVLLRKLSNERFEIIAGERRFRAAEELGWVDIPAIVRDVSDQERLSLALIENIQRANLNPLEEAEAYKGLTDEFGLTQQEVAELVSKDRSTVANAIRLLSLPSSIQELVQQGKLSPGHARALSGIQDPSIATHLGHQAVTEGLSVREIERRAKSTRGKRTPSSKPSAQKPGADIQSLEGRIRRQLQTDIKVIQGLNGTGEIRISFYSPEDLDRLLLILSPNKNS